MAVEKGRKTLPGKRILPGKSAKGNFRRFAIYFSMVSALWICGYVGISFSWVILCLVIAGVWEYRQKTRANARWKRQARCTAAFSERTLPSWACESDDNVDGAGWLNNCLVLLWPHIDGMARKVVKESIEPELQKKLPSSLKGLSFETIDLGRKPPHLASIKTYCPKEKSTKRSEFIIDVDVSYRGDAQIKLAVKGVTLGIADLQLCGPIRIILKPLLSDGTLIGGITVFFLKQPKLSFDLTNLLNVLDFPGLKGSLLNIVDDVIASVAVLPNRIVVPLAGNVDASALRYPMPEGVLQVELLEARDLKQADVSLIGKASSDPYAVVKIGAQSFRSAVKKNNLRPVWNETFEAFVDNCEGQDLEVSLYDKDISKDESLGDLDLSIAGLIKREPGEFWTPLEGVAQGRVLLRTSWFTLSESPLDLYPPEEHRSVAALLVKIKYAKNLLLPAKGKVYCRVTVGEQTQATFDAVVGGEQTDWNQLLRFLLKDPFSQSIQVAVISPKNDSVLGQLTFNTGPLIDETEMTVEDSFLLDDVKGHGTLALTLMLRAFKAANEIITPVSSSQAAKEEVCDITNRDVTCDVICNDVKSPDASNDNRDGPINDAEEGLERVSSSWSETSSSSSSNQATTKNEDPSPSGSLFCVAPPPAATGPVTGEICMELVYSHRRNRLVVKLQRARGLVLHAPKSKPYVTLYLLPDRSKKTLRQTLVYPNSRNPVFDERFEYAIGLDQLRERKLEVTVKNARSSMLSGKSRNVIGKAVVDLSELDLTNGETLSRDIRG